MKRAGVREVGRGLGWCSSNFTSSPGCPPCREARTTQMSTACGAKADAGARRCVVVPPAHTAPVDLLLLAVKGNSGLVCSSLARGCRGEGGGSAGCRARHLPCALFNRRPYDSPAPTRKKRPRILLRNQYLTQTWKSNGWTKRTVPPSRPSLRPMSAAKCDKQALSGVCNLLQVLYTTRAFFAKFHAFSRLVPDKSFIARGCAQIDRNQLAPRITRLFAFNQGGVLTVAPVTREDHEAHNLLAVRFRPKLRDFLHEGELKDRC